MLLVSFYSHNRCLINIILYFIIGEGTDVQWPPAIDWNFFSHPKDHTSSTPSASSSSILVKNIELNHLEKRIRKDSEGFLIPSNFQVLEHTPSSE